MESRYIILFGIALWLPYFLRPDIIGIDSYYYLSQICRTNYLTIGQSNIFTTLLPFIPCSIPLIKLLLGGLFLLDLLIIQEIGKLFGKRYSGILVLLSPILLLEAMRFENEALALPFLLASLFYFLKWKVKFKDSTEIVMRPWKEKIKWDEWAIWGSISYLIVAFAIWKGAIIYAVAFTLPWSIIPVIAYFLLNSNELAAFMPNLALLEAMPFMILGVGLLFTGLLAIPKKVKPEIWLFLLLGVLRVNFLVHTIPFLVLGLEERIMKKYGGIPRFVYVLPFLWIISVFIVSPTPDDWKIVDKVIELEKETGKPVYNEWGRGYWYHYKGLDVNNYGWVDPLRDSCSCPGICVNENEVVEC